MRTALAVFCKTPGLSPVKTRLGAQIGKLNAEEFYKLSLAAVNEVITVVQNKSQGMVTPYWAIAEKESLKNPFWSSFESIWTGEGGLGERIYHVFKELSASYDQVIIIGSDSPQLTADYILKAMEVLESQNEDGIIGPCKDGGFVLLGSKKLIMKSIWTSVTYSRSDTLKQLERELKKSDYQYTILPEQGDVDNYEDLRRLQDSLRDIGYDILPKQQELYDWIKGILYSGES